jgi:hypothetical protein
MVTFTGSTEAPQSSAQSIDSPTSEVSRSSEAFSKSSAAVASGTSGGAKPFSARTSIQLTTTAISAGSSLITIWVTRSSDIASHASKPQSTRVPEIHTQPSPSLPVASTYTYTESVTIGQSASIPRPEVTSSSRSPYYYAGSVTQYETLFTTGEYPPYSPTTSATRPWASIYGLPSIAGLGSLGQLGSGALSSLLDPLGLFDPRRSNTMPWNEGRSTSSTRGPWGDTFSTTSRPWNQPFSMPSSAPRASEVFQPLSYSTSWSSSAPMTSEVFQPFSYSNSRSSSAPRSSEVFQPLSYSPSRPSSAPRSSEGFQSLSYPTARSSSSYTSSSYFAFSTVSITPSRTISRTALPTSTRSSGRSYSSKSEPTAQLPMPSAAKDQGLSGWNQKMQSATFQIILSGVPDLKPNAHSVTPDVNIYDIDLFMTEKSTIQTLKRLNKTVICYFSGGTYEPGRPDSNLFPTMDRGNRLLQWPSERWLRLSSTGVRRVITDRIQLAAQKGCDAIDPDNVGTFYRKLNMMILRLTQY